MGISLVSSPELTESELNLCSMGSAWIASTRSSIGLFPAKTCENNLAREGRGVTWRVAAKRNQSLNHSISGLHLPNSMENFLMKSCVLAYSGGLDTSVILGWLQDQGYEVHAVYVDLGQPCEDREAIMEKARNGGAVSSRIIDAREEMCRDFAFPVLAWQAKYEQIYLLGTSIARPLISKVCLQVAKEVGATAYAHGATGKGNDQCRFQLAAEALDPKIEIIALLRIKEFWKHSRGELSSLSTARAKTFPSKHPQRNPTAATKMFYISATKLGIWRN